MIDLTPIHGGQLAALARRFEVPVAELLDFSANINPDGPPQGVARALLAAIEDPATLACYPDLEERELKQAIAAYAGVESSQIAVSNGFVPLLDAVLATLALRRCLLPVPAFLEYRKALERARVAVSPQVLSAAENFRNDARALVGGDHDAILLANPQNPSGTCTSYSEMVEIVAAAAARDIVVLLDEAFIDYAPEHSLTRETKRFDNLIVFRSVTKFHGMPGLRAAYAVANPGLVARLNAQLAPWPISTLAARGVCAALADLTYETEARARNALRRSLLVDGLHALGIEPHPSGANFLLFRVADSIALWRRMILEHHIVLRDCANYESLGPGYLRAAVRTEAENERLLQALERTLA